MGLGSLPAPFYVEVLMNRRQREVEKMVTDLGLLITSWRTNGSNHWRVDVKTPDGKHQRPFTFPVSGHDGPRKFDEITMLKRWRRQVAPEMDVMEDAGTLTPGRRTSLAESLEKAGIPLKKEVPVKPGKVIKHLPEHLPPSHISDVQLASQALVHGDPKMVRDVESLPPRDAREFHADKVQRFADATEAWLANVTTPAPTTAPKEPAMQTSPTENTAPQRKPHVQHKKREQMSFAEVMKFGSWMNKERLDGYYAKTDFCDHASHVLGFKVSEVALTHWLESNDVQMPQRPVPVKPKSPQELAMESINNDIASIALAITESIPDGPHRNLLLSIVERRTAANIKA